MPSIALRPWHRSDAAALAAACAATPDLATQLGPAMPSDQASARALIERRFVVSAEREDWAITIDGIAVGNIGFSSIDPYNDIGWMYYWLTGAARGQGLATRALASLSRRCFDELGLFRLELGHRVNNPASCAVARRAGFRAEGVERQKLRHGTERFDTETHARLLIDPEPAVAALPFAPVPTGP